MLKNQINLNSSIALLQKSPGPLHKWINQQNPFHEAEQKLTSKTSKSL